MTSLQRWYRLIARGTEQTLQAAENVRQGGEQLGEAARGRQLDRRDAAEAKRLLRSARDNAINLLETLMIVTGDVARAGEAAKRADDASREAPAVGSDETLDAEKPLAGKRICFMGKMSRPHAILAARAAEAGATCTPNVQRGTSFVVLGRMQRPDSFGFRDAKRRRIERIDESEFWRRLGMPGSEGGRQSEQQEEQP